MVSPARKKICRDARLSSISKDSLLYCISRTTFATRGTKRFKCPYTVVIPPSCSIYKAFPYPTGDTRTRATNPSFTQITGNPSRPPVLKSSPECKCVARNSPKFPLNSRVPCKGCSNRSDCAQIFDDKTSSMIIADSISLHNFFLVIKKTLNPLQN